MALWIILGIVVILVLWFVATYNSLVGLRNKVKDQWAQIDVQLKRRADLIPNLVETVKGYAKHESETLENVIKARNTFTTAKTPEEEMKSSGEITQALSKLMMLSESYPELKANENFMSLQNDLKDCEDKISLMRQFYNDVVLKYNNMIETVPSNIVANMGHFEKSTFFEIAEADKEVPKVSFNEDAK
jgi:LemA protein